jgi:hypothetical protein
MTKEEKEVCDNLQQYVWNLQNDIHTTTPTNYYSFWIMAVLIIGACFVAFFVALYLKKGG